MQEVWKVVLLVKFDFLSLEVNFLFVNIVSFSEVVVVNLFYVELDGGGGEMYLILLYLMIEFLCEVLDVGVQSDVGDQDEWWMNLFWDEVMGVKVILKGKLFDKKICLMDLVKMKKGDIILIEMFESLLMLVNGILVFCGKLGEVNGNLVLKVVG